MTPKIRQFLDNLWSGLWFIPGLLTCGGLVAGSAFSGVFGYRIVPDDANIAFNPALGVTVLTSLAGASITVVGVVFSITMVVLSSASTQLGPRLLSNFMRKTQAKFAIGGFVGAFSYQLIVASALAIGKRVPDIAIWVGLLGGLASFAVLLGFLHMVARFIQVPFVVGEVTRNLERALRNFQESNSSNSIEGPPLEETLGSKTLSIFSENAGYLQSIEISQLVELATDQSGTLLLRRRTGQFVAKGDLIAILRSEEDEPELQGKVNSLLTYGPERTAQQDVEYALRQLIEIATKALSPGINDPETAHTVIDQVGGALSCVCGSAMPSGLWYDDESKLRLMIPTPDAAGLFDSAYHPLRQFGSGVESVGISLMESFLRLSERELHPDFQSALRRHIDLLHEAVLREQWLPSDLAEFEERRERALGLLEA